MIHIIIEITLQDVFLLRVGVVSGFVEESAGAAMTRSLDLFVALIRRVAYVRFIVVERRAGSAGLFHPRFFIRGYYRLYSLGIFRKQLPLAPTSCLIRRLLVEIILLAAMPAHFLALPLKLLLARPSLAIQLPALVGE